MARFAFPVRPRRGGPDPLRSLCVAYVRSLAKKVSALGPGVTRVLTEHSQGDHFRVFSHDSSSDGDPPALLPLVVSSSPFFGNHCLPLRFSLMRSRLRLLHRHRLRLPPGLRRPWTRRNGHVLLPLSRLSHLILNSILFWTVLDRVPGAFAAVVVAVPLVELPFFFLTSVDPERRTPPEALMRITGSRLPWPRSSHIFVIGHGVLAQLPPSGCLRSSAGQIV